MFWKQLLQTKSLELLHAEMASDNRLKRVLGKIGLTSLGIGAIIGAGIFVMTGRVAANDAGPGIVLSFIVAGVACALAAFCYAEFASMAPVAGSAYTYAYATLGEIFAWIIGWDLILEYAMSAATVAAVWSKYLNTMLAILFGPEWVVPEHLCNDPFSHPGAWFNLPAVFILGVCTVILVIGIKESAASNTALVILKLGVVLFVIGVGVGFVKPSNWTDIPVEARKMPEQNLIPEIAGDYAKDELKDKTKAGALKKHALAIFLTEQSEKYPTSEYLAKVKARYAKDLPVEPADVTAAKAVLAKARAKAPEKVLEKWGMVGMIGINKTLEKFDDATRSNYMPYGISGVLLGAALVFFAFIGFDSISTHAEEAVNPKSDVPFGIIVSLFTCTILYIAVSAIITGMVPYPEIDTNAAVASAFAVQGEEGNSFLANASAVLIALGALAGMTSVLLITFLSQSRIFLAMARDGLMPASVFGAVHAKFQTPHISTIITGVLMMFVAAFTPILTLEEMVNIGTLFAFVVVCAAVLILRIQRPEAPRPFRCPLVYVVAPLGIAVNLLLMFFLPPATWLRLAIWLGIGLVLYFVYGYHHSSLKRHNAALAAGQPQT